MNAVERDLQLIPSPYRKPLSRFIWHGVIPDGDPELHALICGAPPHNPELLIAGAFLDAHAADLDIAHGHLGLVLRWQYWGGLAGRPPA